MPPKYIPTWLVAVEGLSSAIAIDLRPTASSGVFHSCDDVGNAIVWGFTMA